MARTRTFLAVDIGDAIRERAEAVQRELAATGANMKWVTPASLHITLLFLGELNDKDLADVCRLSVKATANIEPFRISVAGLDAFPNLRRPKVLWAGVNDGSEQLIALFNALEQPLFDARIYRKEERPFTPHLTLGRVKDEADGQLIAPEMAKYRGWTAGMTSVEEVLIMASDLRRDGPEYSVMGRCELRG
jgi:2'-5' RNA ligase